MDQPVTPTVERWADAEEALKSPFGIVELQCDSYAVSLQVVPVATRRFEIGIYIDGWMRGIWLCSDCEERRRFCRPQVRYLFSAKARADAKRKKWDSLDWDKTLTFYRFTWPTFDPLRRHLLKNNQSVRIVKINGIDMEQ